MEAETSAEQSSPREAAPILPSVIQNWESLGFSRGKFRASLGELFPDAFFGRDTATVALHLLPHFRDAAHAHLYSQVIEQLLRVQAVEDNPLTEAQPGKFHHELRAAEMWGVPVESRSREILAELGPRFGGSADFFCYYGSVDSTPLGVLLICRYCATHGTDLLDSRVTRIDGSRIRMEEGLRQALDWIVRSVSMSDIGLLEFQCSNSKALLNQAWQDSIESYIHPHGVLANHAMQTVIHPATGQAFRRAQPIASVEVQGLAHVALLAAAELFSGRDAYFAAGLRRQAELLQVAAIERLWMADEAYFALGIDRNPAGAPRQIRTITAAAAELLNSGLVTRWDSVRERHGRTDLPDERNILSGVLAKIFDPQELLCAAGLRCRSLRHDAALANAGLTYLDYHGHFAAWPKQTYDAAIGLREAGFRRLAYQLEARLLNTSNIANSHYELYYLTKDGLVAYNACLPLSECDIVLPVAARPEPNQAWTISALRALKRKGFAPVRAEHSAPWKQDLEDRILQTLPSLRILGAAEVSERRSVLPRIGLDLEEGRRRQRDFLQNFWKEIEQT